MKSRSILQLIITGFAFILIPLIAFVFTAVFQVDLLAERNQEAILNAETAAQQSHALSEHLTTMERSLVQYLVLGEEKLYGAYLFRRDEFHNSAKQLRILTLSPNLQNSISELIGYEQSIHKKWGMDIQQTSEADPALSKAYASLNDKVKAITIESRELIQLEANNAVKEAVDLQSILLIQAAVAIPATILVAILFAYLITKPIRKLDFAIRDLGAGKFDQPIKIEGPNDLKELGERLNWLRERISELENQKINFLRHISHELKTPLTAIRESSELLSESDQIDLQEEQELIEIIQESSIQLQVLIENLLQFGKNENLFKSLDKKLIDFTEMVNEIISEYSLALSKKSISLSTDLKNINIQADRERLRIVLDNLISNAVRYTPNHGHIRIDLKKYTNQIILEIENSGDGIKLKDQAHIFEPFYRGETLEAGLVKGTGLGLAIVKEHVESHKGKIQALNGSLGALLRIQLPSISISQ